ncbi:SLBB domain-containing protein [Treponema socranskii]|uniref:SLBB domain-containing protein n=1 Tax=Treponema socranskii TaxID=53419 RepID=UPI003D8CD796
MGSSTANYKPSSSFVNSVSDKEQKISSSADIDNTQAENVGTSQKLSSGEVSAARNALNASIAMSSTDYLVTAGDIYTLAFAVNGSVVSYVIPVDASYRIRVANITTIGVAGNTFLRLKQRVEELVTQNYPMSGVQFALTFPAAFKVVIDGEVKETAIKQAWALSRLSDVIAGTLTDYASVRNIVVTSEDGKKNTYDIFKASRFGELSQNPYVRPGDRVTVARMNRKVAIRGAVERPGTYELLEGENLKRLVEYYGGGLTGRADTNRMELLRVSERTDPAGEILYLDGTSIASDYALVCWDTLNIPTYAELKPVMFIEGALSSATSTSLDASTRIPVVFETGENYGTLVRRNKDRFSPTADMKNAYILRGGKPIPIDINQMLYDASYYGNEIVQPNDTLIIPFRQYFVSVAGAVARPGRYPYIPDRTWEYYIGLAGGFVNEKNSGKAITICDMKGKKMRKTDPITPETTITASANSFTYYFGLYAPVITTVLSAVSTTVTILIATKNMR